MAQKERLPRGEWRTSSKSGPNGGNCVECRATNGKIEFRDSKANGLENQLVLGFSETATRAFFENIECGLFGKLGTGAYTSGGEIIVRGLTGGGFGMAKVGDETHELLFTQGELDAFVADVLAAAKGEGNFAGLVLRPDGELALV